MLIWLIWLALSTIVCGTDSIPQRSELDAYAELHRSVLASHRAGEQGRFVIFRDVGCSDICGMGNRLQSMVSALLLAWATDRAFIVDERLTDGTYKCKEKCPRCFPLTSLSDADVPINWRYSQFDADNSIPAWIDWDDEESGIVRHSGPRGDTVVINYRSDPFADQAIDTFSCRDFAAMPEPNIVVYGSQGFTHLLSANPYIGDRILRAFGTHAFASMVEFFLKEPVRLKPRIDAVWSKVAAAGCSKTIGMHVRRHNGREFMDDAGERTMFRCAQWLALDLGDTETCVVLATDMPASRLAALEFIAPSRLVFIDDTAVAPDAAGVAEHTNAVIEWWLLRRVDDMIITGGSSFGSTAAAANRILPVSVVNAVHPQFGTAIVEPTCVRQINASPAAIGLGYLDPRPQRPDSRQRLSCGGARSPNPPRVGEFVPTTAAVSPAVGSPAVPATNAGAAAGKTAGVGAGAGKPASAVTRGPVKPGPVKPLPRAPAELEHEAEVAAAAAAAHSEPIASSDIEHHAGAAAAPASAPDAASAAPAPASAVAGQPALRFDPTIVGIFLPPLRGTISQPWYSTLFGHKSPKPHAGLQPASSPQQQQQQGGGGPQRPATTTLPVPQQPQPAAGGLFAGFSTVSALVSSLLLCALCYLGCHLAWRKGRRLMAMLGAGGRGRRLSALSRLGGHDHRV